MNNLQKGVLFVGGLVLLANLVYPPWESQIVYQGSVIVERMDRGFISDPPNPKNTSRLATARVDWSQLGVTSLVIAVGTGLLFGLAAFYMGLVNSARSQDHGRKQEGLK